MIAFDADAISGEQTLRRPVITQAKVNGVTALPQKASSRGPPQHLNDEEREFERLLRC